MTPQSETGTPSNGFAGLRVLALESRRGPEIAKLISNNGGLPTVAPSMREVPLESNTGAQAFTRSLIAGQFDAVIFLTGVGTRALVRVVETVCPVADFLEALREIPVIARGPKPIAALKELGVPVTLAAPEPNTWRELLQSLDENETKISLKNRRVAVQEYGESNPDLLAGLAQRGAIVTAVPVYDWALPEDTGPLRSAVSAISKGEFDVALFTTSVQVKHLFQIAAEMGLEEAVRAGLSRMLIASIGPVTSERIREAGLQVDLEPSHPKMGVLVGEAAQQSAQRLRAKRHPVG